MAENLRRPRANADADAIDTPGPKHSIAEYDIIQPIGQGGFGKVYRVLEKTTGKEYAIKECYKQTLKDAKASNMVMNERRAMARMNHRFILRLLKAFQDRESLYFVMQLMTGDLREAYDHDGPFSIEVTRFYTAEIIVALEYLRTVQIVHKDVKMENVLLDRNKHIKLADFGCSVQLEPADETSSRRAAKQPDENQPAGTPLYMSPEVLQKGPVTYASDLWALGCNMYEMYVGMAPFLTDQLKTNIARCNLRAFPANTDQDLQDIVQRIMVKDPGSRLGAQNMNELKEHEFYNTIANWDTLHTVPAPSFDTPRPDRDQQGAAAMPDFADFEDLNAARPQLDRHAPGCPCFGCMKF